MSSTVKMFAPEGKVLASSDSWEIQTGANPTISRQRAQALGSDGDEIAAAQYGAQIQYSEHGVAKISTGSFTIPAGGAIVNGAHVDSVDVSYSQTDFPSIDVSSHQHASVAGVAAIHGTCRTYTSTVVLPARAIGVPTTLDDTDGNTIFEMPSGCGMRSLKYSLKVNHVDEPGSAGDHLAAENYDGTETLTLEFTGDVAIADLNIDTTNWMLPESSGLSSGNTSATTTSVTLVRHIAHDTPASSES